MDTLKNKKKILLIELAGIGDAVLSTPAISSLRSCYASSRIDFLTFTQPAEILKRCPYLDKVFILKKGGFFSFFKNFILLLNLRKQAYDVAINLYQLYSSCGAIKMSWLMNFIRPKKKAGRDTDGRGFFYDIKVKDQLNSTRSDVEFKLDLIKALGCKIENPHLELWFDPADQEAVQEFLSANLIKEQEILVGINPGARRLTHRWSWQSFAFVAQRLSDKYQARIILTGTKEEEVLAKKIYNQMSDKPIISSGKFSLPQLAVLIKRCNLYISNDTAPMHIANALEVPLLAIMGAGVAKTAPYQKDKCIVLKKDVACAPCYKFSCKKMKCLNLITPAEVIAAGQKLFKNEKN